MNNNNPLFDEDIKFEQPQPQMQKQEENVVTQKPYKEMEEQAEKIMNTNQFELTNTTIGEIQTTELSTMAKRIKELEARPETMQLARTVNLNDFTVWIRQDREKPAVPVWV